MDATTLLKQDHTKVRQLFKKYEEAGDRAIQTKQRLFDQIKEELDVHAAIEEEIFYPEVKRLRAEDAKDLVLEAIEEHHVVKTLLKELEDLTPEDEAFDAKVKVLCENVDHHATEEETEMFPEVRKLMPDDTRRELGAKMEARKEELLSSPRSEEPASAGAR